MKAGLFITFLLTLLSAEGITQMRCVQKEHTTQQVAINPVLSGQLSRIEQFTSSTVQQLSTNRLEAGVIQIPVVIHNLYHTLSEKVSDEQVAQQLETLNQCFRRQNADSVKTPAVFKSLAADCEIEFKLATSDPKKRFTTGITRTYTPIKEWMMDDKVKFSAEMGVDAWDTKSYLNIWVCNMKQFAGYSSVLGDDEKIDGIVIGLAAFGEGEKTLVHEAGHWLGLKHLWGDDYCGDDGVDDTPKQASYTVGCPSTIRITCGNGPVGDMYTNYMDFTNDACMNLFSKGQKERMRASFASGGVRNSFLSSKGLARPLIFESPLPDQDPTWLAPRFYPNPSTNVLNLDISYDPRWIGKTIFITNVQGQSVMSVVVMNKNQQIDVSRLRPGIYFIAAKKDDGESIKMKFVKM